MKYVQLILLTLLFAPLCLMANGKKNEIRIITLNQYVGTPLTSIALAQNPLEINAALLAALENISRTRTDIRIAAQAETIKERMPHFVGLQEVLTIECEGNCVGIPSIDHLNITLGLLNSAETNYKIAGKVDNFNIKVPVSLSNTSLTPDFFLSIIDSDVILARNGINTSTVDFNCGELFKSAQGCNYQNQFLGVKRGYVGVDATIDKNSYRVVNTHLEIKNALDFAGSIQSRQALELSEAIQSAYNTDIRLLLIGDFNSSPEDINPFPITQPTPYQIFSELLTDTWNMRPGKPNGFTCCQSPLLDNESSLHNRRIDLIFAHPAPKRVKANVLDTYIQEPTLLFPPYWSSDHSPVMGRLYYH